MPDADWTPTFLAALADTANVTEAAKRAGINPSTTSRRRASDPEFAAAWDEAMKIGVSALKLEARRRALEGCIEPVFYKGEEIGGVRKFSDTLMMFLLKAHCPEEFRDNAKVEATVSTGQAKVTIYLPDNGRDPAE